MNHEIKYNGISRNPSDYENIDGDLEVALNLIPEDGSLKPVLLPAFILELEDDESAIFIHKTASIHHYIVYNNARHDLLYYYYNENENDYSSVNIATGIVSLSHVNAVGNTLVVFTADRTIYYLWGQDNNGSLKYKELGDHIPDVNISFGLVGHPRLFSLHDESKNGFELTLNNDNELSEEEKRTITEEIMAKLNKFIADETVNKGRFCFPFLVRYALKCYDGSYIGHSSPILMCPSTNAAPIVYYLPKDDKVLADIMLVAADLDYQIVCDNEFSRLITDWKDIVKSIDIFISKPIYTYDQNGLISSFQDTDNFDTTFIGRLFAKNTDVANVGNFEEDTIWGNFVSKEFLNNYCEWQYQHIYAMYFSEARIYPDKSFHLPEFSDKKVQETIENTHSFYKLTSIDLNNDNTTEYISRKNIVIEDDYLQSLLTRETLSDDYLTHDKLIAKQSFAYNNRLNLSGISRKLFNGFYAASMFAYCDGFYSYKRKSTNPLELADYVTLDIKVGLGTQYSITTFIKENGKDYAVTIGHPEIGGIGQSFKLVPYLSQDRDEDKKLDNRDWGNYVFYPNPNAYKMVVSTNFNGETFVIDLKRHEFLNGAFAFLDFTSNREDNRDKIPQITVSDTNIIDIPNKIYTSEVENPFYFPLLGINTIGTGEIIGISSAAKALSQGQFGQFPLYAFTTDGIWALEVSPTGTYSAKQPISRDVCTNAKSITQLDSAVVFTSDKGLMIISGSNVLCLSDKMNSFDIPDLYNFPLRSQLDKIIKSKTNEELKLIDLIDFNDFLDNCRIVYDYKHQRLIVSNIRFRYSYVYSFKTQSWGMANSAFKETLNSYPNALVVTNNNTVADYSYGLKYYDVPFFMLTRPFKLDQLNSFKTINGIIQRGNISKDSLCQILYGSNDLINWHVVYSSNNIYMQGFSGTPFKYFKLAIIGNLSSDSSLFGCSIDYKERINNKLR